MSQQEKVKGTIHGHQQRRLEVEMVGEERWAEIRRRHDVEGRSISAIARELELDRKTVRRCLREAAWQGGLQGSDLCKQLKGRCGGREWNTF